MNYFDAYIDELTKIAADDDSSKGRAAATAVGGAVGGTTAYQLRRAGDPVRTVGSRAAGAVAVGRNVLRHGENKVRKGINYLGRTSQARSAAKAEANYQSASNAYRAKQAPYDNPKEPRKRPMRDHYKRSTPVADSAAGLKQLSTVKHSPKFGQPGRVGAGVRGAVGVLGGMAAANLAHRAFSK